MLPNKDNVGGQEGRFGSDSKGHDELRKKNMGAKDRINRFHICAEKLLEQAAALSKIVYERLNAQ